MDLPDIPAQEAPATLEKATSNDFKGIDLSFGSKELANVDKSAADSTDQSISLVNLNNLSPSEIQQLAETALDYWKDAPNLDPARAEALQNLEIALARFDGLTEKDSFDLADITSTGLAEAEQAGLDIITQLIEEAAHPVALERMLADTIAAREVDIPNDQIPITLDTLDSLITAAEQRWAATGLSREQLNALDQIEYKIVDLEAHVLANAEGYEIKLDLDAAGRDWFIDLTPFEDEEFNQQVSLTALRATEGAATYGIDLLSVLMHEQGHVLGLEHAENQYNIMAHTFTEGERRLLIEGQAEGAVAGSLDGVENAITPIFSDSFENPDVTGGIPSAKTDFANWDEFGSVGVWAWDEDTGLFEAADGTQVAAVGYNGSGIETNSITETLQASTKYALTFNVGNAETNGNPRGDIEYTAELVAVAADGSKTVLGSSTAETSTDDMSETGSITFVTTPDHTDNIGETLQIRFYHSNNDSNRWRARALFDNVLLTAESTASDTTAPTPSAIQFDVAPHAQTETSIYMQAEEVSDPSGVQYLFTNTDTNATSGWQDSREWLDTGLTPGNTYNYTIQARDKSANLNTTGTASASAVATEGLIFYDSFENPNLSDGDTADFPNWNEPRGRVWVREDGASITTPFGDQAAAVFLGSPTSYRLETSSITDVLEASKTYTLEFNVGNVHSDGNPRNGIQYTAELLAGTTVVASTSGTSDKDDMSETGTLSFTTPPAHGNIGETLSIRLYQSGGAWQSPIIFDNVSLVGITLVDTTAPTPDPIQFDLAPRAKTETSIYMRAQEVSDPSGVQYLFTREGTAVNSGWQDSHEWTDTGLTPGDSYSYTVKARDLSSNLNETGTATSSSVVATIGLLLYDSFENPVISGRSEGVIPGWVGSDSRTGPWNEDSGTMTTPFDDQAAYVWNNRELTTTTDSLDEVLAANTLYTLSFNAAAEGGNGNIPYDVQLLAGSSVLASKVGSPLTTSDFSVSDSITFQTGATHANLGETLAIKLRSKSGGAWQYVIGYDNVSLTAVLTVAANDDSGTTSEDATTSTLTGGAISLLSNDSPTDGAVTEIESNLSGGPVSLAVNGGSASITTDRGASVTVNQNGSFTYDPSGSLELQALGEGESVEDTFTYTMTDSLANAQAPVLVAYYPLNDGNDGEAVTGADDLVDDADNLATDATADILDTNLPGGTWVNDPDRGIVYSTTENDHLNAGKFEIEGDFTWSLWVKTTDVDSIMGTRDGTFFRLSPTALNGWISIDFPDVNDGEWHHLAVRREGSTAEVFVDGVSGGTRAKTGDLTNTLEIGGHSRFTKNLTGLISDVGIWEGALSNAQIESLAAGTTADQAVPVAETRSATVTFTVTGSNDTPEITIETTAGTITEDASGGASETVSSSDPAAPSLVAYYPLNDGAAGTAVTGADDTIDDPGHPAQDAVAEVTSGNSGTWVDDPTRGIVFSTGEDDRLDGGTQGSSGDFTWSAWVNTNDGGTVIGNRAGGTHYVRLASTGVTGSWLTSSIDFPDVNDGTWHHLVLQKASGTLTAYVDGIASGSTTTKTEDLIDAPLEIGGTSRFSEDLTGLISDVAIWDGALSVAEIQSLAAGRKPTEIYADVDLADTHTVTGSYNGDVAWSAGTLTDPQKTAILDASTFTATASGWSYSINNPAIQFLNDGETLTLSYDLTVTDDSGATNDSGSETVTITINGESDNFAPSLSAISSPAAVSELVDASAQDILAITGNLTIQDADSGDSVTAAIDPSSTVSVTLSGGGSIPSAVESALQAALSFTGNPVIANGASQTIGYSFDPPALALDFLAVGQTITVTFPILVNDGTVDSGTQNLVITILGTNDAPVLSAITAPPAVTEDGDASVQDLAAITGDLPIQDLDIGDTVTPSIVGSAAVALTSGGTVPAGVISALGDSSILTFGSAITSDGTNQTIGYTYNPGSVDLDFIAVGDALTITYTVKVNDTTADSATQEIVITINGTNETPTDLSLSANTIAENTDTTAAVAIGNLTATDEDHSAHTFTLAAGSGDTDNTKFEIVGNELRIRMGEVVDFEAQDTYSVRINANDGTADYAKVFTINVTDLNEAPSVTLNGATTSLSESADTSSSTKVADIEVNNDALGAADLSLIGDDADLFEISGTELHLKSGISLDFESNPVLDVTVEVNDPTLSPNPNSSAALSINLINANEAPNAADDTFTISSITPSLTENVLTNPDGLDTDPDAGTTLTVSQIDTETDPGNDVSGSYGDLDWAADGTFTYTVKTDSATANALAALAPGASVSDSFTYTTNDGGLTDTATITINIQASIFPIPSTPDLAATSDSGTSNSDNLTSDRTPTISGTAASNSTVEIFANDVSIGTTTTSSSGEYSFTPATELAEGVVVFTATASDGNDTSVPSLGLTVTIDASAPSTSNPVLDSASDSNLNTDGVTNDDTPTLTGAGLEAGATVEIFDNGSSIGTTTVQPDGSYSFSPTLTVGLHNLTATVTDAAGNSSAISSPTTVTIDTSAPEVTGASAELDGTTLTVTLAFDDPTTDLSNPGSLSVEIDGAAVTANAAPASQAPGRTYTYEINDLTEAQVAAINTNGATVVASSLTGASGSDLAGNAIDTNHRAFAILTPNQVSTDFAGISGLFNSISEPYLFFGAGEEDTDRPGAFESLGRTPLRAFIAGTFEGQFGAFRLTLNGGFGFETQSFVIDEVYNLLNGNTALQTSLPWDEINGATSITIEGIPLSPTESDLIELANYPINLRNFNPGAVPGQIVGELLKQIDAG